MNGKLSAVVRLIALGLLLISTACAVATPAPPSATEAPAEAEVVELVYQNWTARDEEMPWERELIAKFEETHPNIKVKLSVVPYAQHHDKIVVATKAGTPPDVFQVIPEDMIAFVASPAIAAVPTARPPAITMPALRAESPTEPSLPFRPSRCPEALPVAVLVFSRTSSLK